MTVYYRAHPGGQIAGPPAHEIPDVGLQLWRHGLYHAILYHLSIAPHTNIDLVQATMRGDRSKARHKKLYWKALGRLEETGLVCKGSGMIHLLDRGHTALLDLGDYDYEQRGESTTALSV
jgi:hypothetical protein